MATCFLLSGVIFAQVKTVKGTVTDSDGVPLPGASIVLIETNEGATTDFDGNYSISAQEGATVEFSYVGYENQQVVIGEGSTINVTLVQGNALSEVVVTSLGIVREKRELTYATQTVDSKGIDESRASGSLVNSLQGKVAGISITTQGSGVDGASKVILRGNRSIAGSSQPLYVVDGVPLGGDISDLSPDDIESISVLRGSNASALYGARASNGAIIITTKVGEKDSFTVNVNSTITFESPNIQFDYQNEYGQGSGGIYNSFSTDSWGPKLGGSQPHWSIDPAISGNIPFVNNPDNISDFFNTGISFANNVSISAGGENTRTFFGYTNDSRKGIIAGNELNRHNINLKIDNDMLDGKLKLSAKLNFIKSITDNRVSTGESYDNPLRHLYRMPRNIRTQDASNFEFVDASGNIKQNYWKPNDNGGANPYWTINRNNSTLVSDRVVAYTSLTYEIMDNLNLMVRSSLDNNSTSREAMQNNDTYIIADNGAYYTSNASSLEFNNDFLLSYDKDLNQDLSIGISVGGNTRMNRSRGVNTNNGGLNAPNIFALSNAQNLTASQFISEKDVNSLYAFSNIGYKNALFLDLTYRKDWSSTLPADNNNYDFISAGLSSVISDFVDLPELFDFFKVRGSFAQTGNDTAPYSLERLAQLQAGGFISLQTTAPASNLKPEKTSSMEVGFETTLLNQRLSLDFTYYKSNTMDQLFRQSVPQASGVTTKFVNGADVQNSGIEAVVNIGIIKSQDLSWDLTLNYAANKSEILDISDSQDELTYGGGFYYDFKLEKGQPFGSLYSRGFVRNAQGQVLMNANGTPQITPGKTVNIGNYNPDWLGGIMNTITYKNFNLRFLIDIRQGGVVGSFTKTILASDGLLAETAIGRTGGVVFGTDVYAHETPAGAAASVDPETFWTSIGGRNAPVGEAFIEDASNIRLRELSLGYDFTDDMLAGLPFKNAKLSVVGRNLFFLSNSATIDPEVTRGSGLQDTGFESFSSPTTRSLGLNLKLGF